MEASNVVPLMPPERTPEPTAPRPGALGGPAENAQQAPAQRALHNALRLIEQDPSIVVERRVGQLKPLLTMLVERVVAAEGQLIEAARRLQEAETRLAALEAKRKPK